MAKHRILTIRDLKNKCAFNAKRRHKVMTHKEMCDIAMDYKEMRDKVLDDIIDRMAERSRQKRIEKKFGAAGYTKANALMFKAEMDKQGGR